MKNKYLQTTVRLSTATLFFMGISLFAQTLVYREHGKNHEEIHTYVIRKSAPGFQITLTRQTKLGVIEDECETDDSLATLRWTYRNPFTLTELQGIRRENQIELSGTHEGKKIEKTFRIDSSPWRQLFSIDFEEMAREGGGKKFWTIGTSGPGNMEAAQFTVEPLGEDFIDGNKNLEKAWHLRISVSGWKSLFWHGDYWFRNKDRRYIYFRGKSILGQIMVKELIREE